MIILMSHGIRGSNIEVQYLSSHDYTLHEAEPIDLYHFSTTRDEQVMTGLFALYNLNSWAVFSILQIAAYFYVFCEIK